MKIRRATLKIFLRLRQPTNYAFVLLTRINGYLTCLIIEGTLLNLNKYIIKINLLITSVVVVKKKLSVISNSLSRSANLSL